MNIVNGKILNFEESLLELENIDKKIINTLENSYLYTEIVIAACNKLSESITKEEYLKIANINEIEEYKIEYYYKMIKFMLSEEYLKEKVKSELNNKTLNKYEDINPVGYHKVREKIYPLGTLLHITSGNADGLPVFSIIEGLLTGNINILKMPTTIENDISELILLKLMEIEPLLKEYIYIFDYSSERVDLIEKMAEVSDAIVVWGGNNVVKAVRNLAKPNIKIIEWGHKISFVYIDIENLKDIELYEIAEEISLSNQLYCSSPQGIYLNTEDAIKTNEFAKKFILTLDEISKKYKLRENINLETQIALEIQTEKINSIDSPSKIYQGEYSNIIVYNNSELRSSMMFRNPWIKPLKEENIIKELKKYKNYLQTVGLITSESKREKLADKFIKSGAVRVCKPIDMSKNYTAMPHDGELTLLRYTKQIVLE